MIFLPQRRGGDPAFRSPVESSRRVRHLSCGRIAMFPFQDLWDGVLESKRRLSGLRHPNNLANWSRERRVGTNTVAAERRLTLQPWLKRHVKCAWQFAEVGRVQPSRPRCPPRFHFCSRLPEWRILGVSSLEREDRMFCLARSRGAEGGQVGLLSRSRLDERKCLRICNE